MLCPNCGLEAAPDDRVCMGCETPLTVADSKPASVAAAPVAAQGQRLETAAAPAPQEPASPAAADASAAAGAAPAKRKKVVSLFSVPGADGKPAAAPKRKRKPIDVPRSGGTTVMEKPAPKKCMACGSSAISSDGICGNCGEPVVFSERDDFKVRVSDALAVRSFIGRHHSRNEDFGTVAAEVIGGKVYSIVIISDGVSSSERSNLASESACKAGREEILKRLRAGEQDHEVCLRAGVDAAQKAVLSIPCIGELDSRGERKDPPEATFIAAIVVDRKATIIWVGDCRAYKVPRIGGAALLTKDHSWINQMVDAGEMTLADAMNDKLAHAICQTLGPQGEGFALEPDVVTVDLSDCRLLVISSDGFWNYAHPMQDQPPEPLNDLIAGLPQNAEALTVAETLVKFANESGGHDNITVAAIRL